MKKIFKSNVSFLVAFGLFNLALVVFTGCRKDNANETVITGDETDPATFIGNEPGSKYVSNQVIFKYKKDVNHESSFMIYEKIGAKFQERIVTEAMKADGDMEGIILVNVNGDIFEAIEKLKAMPEIEYAEPNYIYTHSSTSNDPYYTGGNLWGMYGASTSPANQYGSHAGVAWAAGHTGSNTVYVGIIDEGVMFNHTDLAGSFNNPGEIAADGIDNDLNGFIDDVTGWDFVSNDNTTYDGSTDDHGTHVAGTIGAIGGNSTGVAGVCWNVQMISAKFLGTTGGTLADAVKAVDYFTTLKAKGVNIVATNNSWGGGGYSQSLYDAIERANNANILFVAAAGNGNQAGRAINNDTKPSYPSSYSNSNVIAVAAIDYKGAKASWSNYGKSSVDLGAPGVNIYSTLPGNSYGSYNGTSMATPHVTGGAALYASTNTTATAAQIKAAILGSTIATKSLNGKCVTSGRLNVSGF